MIFRKEVIIAQKNIDGHVILFQPKMLYLSSIFSMLLFVVLLIYLTQASYSRKETVKGYLIPKSGVVKIYPERAGTVDEIFVNDGGFVEAGQPIAKIMNRTALTTGSDLPIALGKEISAQINELDKELKINNDVFQQQLELSSQQLTQKKKSLNALVKMQQTGHKKVNIKNDQYEANNTLHKKGFLSKSQLSIIQEDYLDSLEESKKLESDIASILLDISTLESEKNSLPSQFLLKEIAIKRQISELKAKLIEISSQHEVVEKAPTSGIVTAIQPEIGTKVNIDTPILSVIPLNSPLEIELLLPTRSAGFVRNGDPIKVRFDAFPYQKFGFITGEVINIDKSLVLPGEKIIPLQINEAAYRVRAKLSCQKISAYGKLFPLKIGMQAEADIILEKRTLLEWLFEPIYSLKGKLG